jgi:hypothetical protein
MLFHADEEVCHCESVVDAGLAHLVLSVVSSVLVVKEALALRDYLLDECKEFRSRDN